MLQFDRDTTKEHVLLAISGLSQRTLNTHVRTHARTHARTHEEEGTEGGRDVEKGRMLEG